MKIHNDVILLHLKLFTYQKVNELAVNGTYIMSVDSAFASYFAQCMQYECTWNCIMWFNVPNIFILNSLTPSANISMTDM